jgi:hypothetical protein
MGGPARRPSLTGIINGVAAACLACGLTASPAFAERSVTAIEVRGAVTDEAGVPVPGQTIRLLKSRSILNLAGLNTRDQNVEETRATTDGHGLFEFTFPVDSQFRYYYLRFYDPATFDAVKYRLPEDSDISRRVRSGRPVQATIVLRQSPEWPRVKALIDEYGPGSHPGQILRSLGLPSRRDPQDAGRELWVYERAGVSYLIEGTKVLETRRAPRSGAAPAAQPAPGEEPPSPAVRVEEP